MWSHFIIITNKRQLEIHSETTTTSIIVNNYRETKDLQAPEDESRAVRGLRLRLRGETPLAKAGFAARAGLPEGRKEGRKAGRQAGGQHSASPKQNITLEHQ